MISQNDMGNVRSVPGLHLFPTFPTSPFQGLYIINGSMLSQGRPLVSATQIVKYAGRGFWAYDVAVGIFIKHLLDAAEKSGEAHRPWLSKAMSDWRVQAVVMERGFTIDERWSAEERDAFIAMAEQACAAIATREFIPVAEIVGWPFVDDLRIFPRTAAREIRTAPIVELGRAMVALLFDRLPAAPRGEAWFFGTPDGRSTIKMQPGWDGRW